MPLKAKFSQYQIETRFIYQKVKKFLKHHKNHSSSLKINYGMRESVTSTFKIPRKIQKISD